MTTLRRINVGSGRPLEHLAHYSRALRVGDMVLQSGTTSIDTDGNVIGEGDIAAQVDHILSIATDTMGQAGGKLEDVVRARYYITDASLADEAGRALGKYFGGIRPAATMVQVNRLARPAQLIEIELEAVDGAKNNAKRISTDNPYEEIYGYSRAVRTGPKIFVSGCTDAKPGGGVHHPGDMTAQTRRAYEVIAGALSELGGGLDDLIYTKTFLTDITQATAAAHAREEMLDDIRAPHTVLGIPGLVHPDMLVEVEAEAIVGVPRHEIFSDAEDAAGYARAVCADNVVHVSGCIAVGENGASRAPDDWALQYDLAHEMIKAALNEAGAELDDVIRRRMFTIDSAEQNRPYGEGPAWFAKSRPVSMGCRIEALDVPGAIVIVDAVAVKGAHANIEWVGPAKNLPD